MPDPLRTIRLAALAALLSCPAAQTADSPSERLLIIRSDTVVVRFDVEIADSAAARRRGLMGRRRLGPRHGMWFDFEQAGPVSMWMKNTLIPLDMLFANENGIVVHVRAATTPMSLERIRAAVPVRYVLELNAGSIAAYALGAGDRIMLAPD